MKRKKWEGEKRGGGEEGERLHYRKMLLLFHIQKDISNLAQDLIKMLCENYTATPPLVLGLLWQCLLDVQGDAQTLVLDMEWILAKFPAHVAGIVSKIGRALFLPTNFQANPASNMNSNHFSYPVSPPSLFSPSLSLSLLSPLTSLSPSPSNLVCFDIQHLRISQPLSTRAIAENQLLTKLQAA